MRRFLLTGHVDHGKSTLGGQLLYQCGAIDEREVQKVFVQAEQDKMYSFRFARLLDINEEEQAKGVTQECNEIEFKHKDNQYKLIDTPGHKLYVRNLIDAVYRNTGNGNVVGVLVLSSLPSELEAGISGGQVKEDILLLRAIGIDSIIVAINKLDKFDKEKAEKQFEETQNKVLPIIKSARYRQIEFTATSGLEGKGIIDSYFPSTLPLMDIIDKLSSTDKKETLKLTKNKTDSNLKAKIFILNCNIFSPGYTGMIHMSSGEYNFNVEKLLNAKKPFIKTGEQGTVILSLDNKITINDGERIVLRNGDSTIAYGLITM